MASNSAWDPQLAKAQLRVAAQRLGQLQDRKDSLAHITSRDIATLLGQRNVSLARTKAQNLMKEDAISDVMEVLEMYCRLTLERFAELEGDEPSLTPSTIEAVSSIIYAAAFTECQELLVVKRMLVDRLGLDFVQSVLRNKDGHVPQRILRSIHSSPSADDIDAYLSNIARKFGVDWKPQLKTDEKLAILSEMLDASDMLATVDLEKLREIASSGIPADPSWLRPRVWKLLLGIIPLMKIQWQPESQSKRNSYYDLIRRLLVNIPSLPPPITPLSVADKSLLALAESLSRVPAHLFRGLEDEVEELSSCPLYESASPDVKIAYAFSLDARLRLIQDGVPKSDDDSPYTNTPEIRLDSGSAASPPREAPFDLSEAAQGASQDSPRTLSLSTALAPKVFRSIPAHPSHVSALLRLLYIHKSLNPRVESPHLASLLLPVYTVMNQEADPTELAHVEADTFWLFEVLIREVVELEEADGGIVWMKKFRERLAMADNELLDDLTLKGLDPALPQYSYRWLAPVLSHTLPLPSVLMAWDSIFAQPEMSRESNPRLERLLDICTAMLMRARARLLLLGKSGRKSPSLWDVEPSSIERQALRPWELGDAFMEGMTLLQDYPIDEAGGMERVLQVAGDIFTQREQLTKPAQVQNTGFGALIRERVWKGITNQSVEENHFPEDSDEEEAGNETETESERVQSTNVSRMSSVNLSWGSYLKTSVVRGITNESAMDPESPVTSPVPSPVPSPTQSTHELPPHPRPSAPKEKSPALLTVPIGSSSLWNYAEKLRQSDMAAKLSKASTNISAKALDAWTARSVSTREGPVTPEKHFSDSTLAAAVAQQITNDSMGEFGHGPRVSISRSEGYSPPPRPAFFKPVRDTRMFSQEELDSLKILDSPESSHSSLSASTLSPGEHKKMGSVTSVLPSWSRLQPKSPKPTKSAPKPLLLSASSLVTSSPGTLVTRSANSTPTPGNLDWADVIHNKAMMSPRDRDSQFSQSSLSSRGSNPIASAGETKSGWDSDQSVSRIVRLNRGSVSPMAPAFRIARPSSRHPSVSSQSEFGVLNYRTTSESSPVVTSRRPQNDESRSARSCDRISPDSPSTLPSSPPPHTPVTNVNSTVQSSVRVADADRQRGSIVLSETGLSYSDTPSNLKKASRKPSSPTVVTAGDTSDSSVPSAAPLARNVARVRTRRLNNGQGLPASLRIQESNVSSDRKNIVTSVSSMSPSSLAAPEFDSEHEVATTPRAAYFPSSSPTSPRHRKPSMEDPEQRRKMSGESTGSRTRKMSNESRSARSRKISNGSYSRPDSEANDGDDEGYDEFLSAYETASSEA